MSDNLNIKGTLIPIGGNEDKGDNVYNIDNEYKGFDFATKGVLSHVVRESGGTRAKIIVIPTASSIPDKVGKNYLRAFYKLGCASVEVINIRSRSDSNSSRFLKLVEDANCVMLSGGDQSRISDIIGGTKMHELLMERFRTDNFVIAGTSAGAMCMSTEMIAGGSSTEALLKGAVQMSKGMNFLPQLIIDTHFTIRGRFGRLAEAVAIYPNTIGVGLAEDTGLIIKHCNEFKVIGSGMVIVMDPSVLTHNSYVLLNKGAAMSMSNLITHILANGDRFTIDKKKIDILPLDSELI